MSMVFRYQTAKIINDLVYRLNCQTPQKRKKTSLVKRRLISALITDYSYYYPHYGGSKTCLHVVDGPREGLVDQFQYMYTTDESSRTSLRHIRRVNILDN